MAIKKYKPTTPGRRGMTVTDYSVLSKVDPERRPPNYFHTHTSIVIRAFPRFYNRLMNRASVCIHAPEPLRPLSFVDHIFLDVAPDVFCRIEILCFLRFFLPCI